MRCCVQMKTTPIEAEVEEESEVLRCVRELQSDLADLRQDNSSSPARRPAESLDELRPQMTKFEEEQKVARLKLEAQTSAVSQLQDQMQRIEQLCIRMNKDLNTLTAKA